MTLHKTLGLVVGLVLPMTFAAVPGQAAFSAEEQTPLEQKDIASLNDDKLVETYIEVLSEIEASKTFHTTSGFTPKEYKIYKDLVRYRLQILFEIHRRKIELPPSVS